MPATNKSQKDFNPSISHPYYFIRKGLYDKIRQYAPQLDGDVLDFGCGAKPYRDLFLHCKSYVGVDYESAGHSHANEQIDFFYDGKTLPFDAGRFDGLFASEVFEHLFNLEEILPELNRVLKPGGKMLITCPFAWPEHEKPYDYARYTVFALRALLEKNGFEMVTIDKSGNFFTAVHQLRMVYFYHHVCAKFSLGNRVPFLASLARAVLTPLLNLRGWIGNAILPGNQEFYLNNIILVQKRLP